MRDFVLYGTKVTILALAIPLAMIAIMLGCHTILSIRPFSTREAPGYVEKKFAQIKIGLLSNEVIDLLGWPLSYEVRTDGAGTNVVYEWWFTQPKEPIDDWGSWDARMLVISNGAVAEVLSSSLQNH